jgi:hypothetical protein
MFGAFVAGEKDNTRRVKGKQKKCRYGVPGQMLVISTDYWVEMNSGDIWDEYTGLIRSRPSPQNQKRAMRNEYRVQAYKCHEPDRGKWKHQPAMLMPIWACMERAMLTDLREQRVQEITEEEAIREGVRFWYAHKSGASSMGLPARIIFAQLWDSINGERGYSWAENPEVWALGIKRVVAEA